MNAQDKQVNDELAFARVFSYYDCIWTRTAYPSLEQTHDYSNRNLQEETLNTVLIELKKTKGSLSLDLSCNFLDNKCMKRITEFVLTRKKALRQLNVSYNPISDSGLKHLFPLVTTNSIKLQTLELESCGLTCKSMKLIGKVFAESNHLQVLGLANNCLKDEGVRLLCNGLKSLKSMQRLKIQGTKLSNAGIEFVIDLLKENHHIKAIHLSFNRLNDDAGQKILGLLQRDNFKLETVLLDGTDISVEIRQAIVNQLHDNRTNNFMIRRAAKSIVMPCRILFNDTNRENLFEKLPSELKLSIISILGKVLVPRQVSAIIAYVTDKSTLVCTNSSDDFLTTTACHSR